MFTNNSPAAIAGATFQANLPAQLTGVAGSCTVSDGSDAICTVSATGVTWTGNWPGTPSAPANTITINYQVTVADGLPPGTELCISSTLSFNSDGPQTVSVTDCGTVTCPLAPTAVRLAFFRATVDGGTVRLEWRTESEIDVLGFNVLRSRDIEGPYVPINEAMLPAVGSASRGASYNFSDRPGNGTFFYRLEDLSGDGKRTRHEIATARVGAGTDRWVLYLPSLSTRRVYPSLWMRPSGGPQGAIRRGHPPATRRGDRPTIAIDRRMASRLRPD